MGTDEEDVLARLAVSGKSVGRVPQLVFAFTQILAKLVGGAGSVCAAAAASAGGGVVEASPGRA